MFTQSAFSVKWTGTPFSCRATRATAASSTPAAAMVHRGSSSSGHASLQVSWDHKVQEYMEVSLGVEQFSAMQTALTVPPLHTCVRVNTLRTTPQEVAEQLHELLAVDPVTADTAAPGGTPATPPAAAASTANSNAHSNGCQSSGSSAGSRYGISCHPQVPAVILEGSGPHAVDLSTVSKQVLISRKAGEAVLRGAHVFIPSVLGCSAGVCAGDTVAVMVDMGGQGSTATRGVTLPALHQADNSDNSTVQQQQQQQQWLCAGIGKACVGRVEMFRLQHGVAVELTQRLYDVPSLNGQLQGLVMLQNLPSIVAAQVLNPPPGSRVLDMCASPGGKTTMLAQIMGGVGQVYALDRSHAKVDDIRSLAQELGCSSCITAVKMDATKAVAADGVGGLPSDEQQQSSAAAAGDGTVHVKQDQQQQQQQDAQQVEPLHELPQQQQLWPQQQQLQQLQQQGQQQQAVLAATANMSAKSQQRLARRLAAMAARGHKPGAGEFRKCGSAPAVPKFPGFAPESFSHVLLDAPCTALGLRPKLQQPLTLREVLEAAAYQRQLLAAAVRLVQPGGYLVYSTCSVSPAENEINVRHALDTYPCLRLVPAEPRVGGRGLTDPADGARFAAVLAEAAASCADKPIPSVTVAAKEAAAAVAAASSQGVAAFWLTDEQASMVQRFHPGGQHDTIGFFAAKFQKVCSFE